MSDHDAVRTADDQLPRQSPGTPSQQSPGRRWIVSIFGDITRTGTWPPRPTTSPFALFGDIDLDLRHATIPVGGLVINAIAPFGNIEVLVPDGALVDVGGFTLFGSKKVAVDGSDGGESVAQIRVRGFSLFGSLKVRSS
jgi:Cell wall-active antibiotics response LiaF, C-terminal